MASYSYIMINTKGKEVKGVIEADSTDEVMKALRAEGNIPISVSEANVMNKNINISFGKRVSSRNLSIFCRQFGSILTAGVTIVEALTMLSRQTENKTLSEAINDIKMSVEKGETLTGALSMHRKIFPPIMIYMVEAGEASGSLETAFERLSTHFEKDTVTKSKLKKAMIYPIVILVVMVAVIFIMLIVVIPNFADMFAGMDTELPALTKGVLSMSNFVKKWWYLMILAIILIIIGINFYKKSPSGKIVFSKIALKLPLFGKLNIKTSSARFSRTLSTLLSTGISMMDALEITSRVIDNVIIKQAIMDAKEDVSKGVALSVPLVNSGVFPSIVSDMVAIGEETGSIDRMLNKLADYYEEEVNYATDSIMAAMEPMIIVIMALVVGFLIAAMMAPIMKLYQTLDTI